MPHDLLTDGHASVHSSTADEAVRWSIGLLFSGAFAAVQSWQRRRAQEKQWKQHLDEVKQLTTPPSPEASEPSENIRTIIEDIRREVRSTGALQDERHAANLQRFEGIEDLHRINVEQLNSSIQDVRQDVRQGRTEVQDLRRDTATQTKMITQILSAVGKIQKPDTDSTL